MSTKIPSIVIIGDSEGMGHAVLLALLKQSHSVNIIGISRRKKQDIADLDSIPISQQASFHHICFDFLDNTEALVSQLNDKINALNSYLKTLILVTGSGFLDSEIEKDPALGILLKRLNYDLQIELIEGLTEKNLLLPSTKVIYFSALITHDSITDPLLKKHASIKKKTTAWLKQRLDNQLVVILPGAYKTDMLMRIIQRQDSLLEWFSLPLSDLYEAKGIGYQVANIALDNKPHEYKEVILPRSVKFIVSLCSANTIRKMMPFAIQQFARTVLTQIGQTDEDHDRRVENAKSQKLYGEDFPYDSIKSTRLWSLTSSLRLANMFKLFGLMK